MGRASLLERLKKARIALESFEEGLCSPYLDQCECVVVVTFFRTGLALFSLGVGTGFAFARVRDCRGGWRWSGPCPVTVWGGGGGLGLGFQKQSALLLLRDPLDVESLKDSDARFTIGKDVGYSLGKASSDRNDEDFSGDRLEPLVFGASKGVYLGAMFSGCVLSTSKEDCKALYDDENATAETILSARIESSARSESLAAIHALNCLFLPNSTNNVGEQTNVNKVDPRVEMSTEERLEGRSDSENAPEGVRRRRAQGETTVEKAGQSPGLLTANGGSVSFPQIFGMLLAGLVLSNLLWRIVKSLW